VPYWGSWRYKQQRAEFIKAWKKAKWSTAARVRFLQDFDRKASEAEKYDRLKRCIRRKAKWKGISPDDDKKLKWWDWEDFEHEAILRLLEVHTGIDTELSEEMNMELPIGRREADVIVYYDGWGREKRAPWLDAIVNMANKKLRPARGWKGWEIKFSTYNEEYGYEPDGKVRQGYWDDEGDDEKLSVRGLIDEGGTDYFYQLRTKDLQNEG
jgi:hypothetical protein